MHKWSSKTKNTSMQNNNVSLYNKHVGIINVSINCLVKEKNLIEIKNDLFEEWCIADDCLCNWLLFYVCINECVKEVKEG